MHFARVADMFRARSGMAMAQLEVQARVLEEWFRLPESRRQHATDAVAFAFRVLREHPEWLSELKDASHELIVDWLMPHVSKQPEAG